MLRPYAIVPHSRRALAGLLVLLLVPALAADAAQTAAIISGHVSIERVGIPSTRLEVTLSPLLGGGSQKTFSDSGGKFSFSVFRPGTYLVSVKAPHGAQFQDGSTEVRVDRIGRGQIFTATVVLELVESAATTRPAGRTLSVDEVQPSIPKQAKKIYERGAKAASAGRALEAIALFRQALAIAPGYLFALNDLGVQLLKLRRFEESEEALRRAVTVAPGSFNPRLNLALTLLGRGKPGDARTEIGRALELLPDEPNALFVLGKVERALGRNDAAAEAFQKSFLTSAAQVGEAMIELGRLYEDIGDVARAEEAYHTYLEAAPQGPHAEIARERLRALGKPPDSSRD